jgi:hypothetical protein
MESGDISHGGTAFSFMEHRDMSKEKEKKKAQKSLKEKRREKKERQES